MNSWDKYYEHFKSFLKEDVSYRISLKDNDKTYELLEELGYSHSDSETLDDCRDWRVF